eukprot:1157234-Pelagomonas_calceolata.AAC.13
MPRTVTSSPTLSRFQTNCPQKYERPQTQPWHHMQLQDPPCCVHPHLVCSMCYAERRGHWYLRWPHCCLGAPHYWHSSRAGASPQTGVHSLRCAAPGGPAWPPTKRIRGTRDWPCAQMSTQNQQKKKGAARSGANTLCNALLLAVQDDHVHVQKNQVLEAQQK